MAKKEQLHGGLGDVGAVDMFGLDEFGMPLGGGITGAVAGAGIQTGAAIAIRQFTSYDKYSEALGGAVGALAGGVMIAFPKTRYAGWVCMATALVNGALRQLERSFGGLSGVDIEQLRGLGEVQIEGLEAAAVEQPYQLSAAQPELVGAGLGNAADQVQLNGGPQISGLGAHFGSTLFSHN